MDASVGPIRVEVIKGLEQVRVIVEPNEWGIELDAVYQGFSEAHLESRHFDRQFNRVIFDSTRFAQVGSWNGTLKVGDREVRLTPDRWWGSRDRSWGVRPVGEAEPPGIRVTDTEGGFFWIYAPVRFEDHAMVTIIQERPSGERIMQDAHRVFAQGSGREAEWLGRPEHQLRFAPGSRTVTGATLTYFGAHGDKTAEVEVETLLAFPLLLGSGYGLEPDWKHGMYQGELVVQGQAIPPADPTYSNWGLTEYAARFTYDGPRRIRDVRMRGDGPAPAIRVHRLGVSPGAGEVARPGSKSGQPGTDRRPVLPEGAQARRSCLRVIDGRCRPRPPRRRLHRRRSMRITPTLAASSPHRMDWWMVKRIDSLAAMTLS